VAYDLAIDGLGGVGVEAIGSRVDVMAGHPARHGWSRARILDAGERHGSRARDMVAGDRASGSMMLPRAEIA
jgi:hypothetical protein